MATSECCVSFETGLEETFDFICKLCKETNLLEAEKYCHDCDQHYCLICVDLHKRFPALKNHVILDRGDIEHWGKQTKIPILPTETGERHPGKLVELFCGQHKELCCHICVSLDHRMCEGMLFIAEAAKGVAESEDMKTVSDDLETNKLKVEETKEDIEFKNGSKTGRTYNQPRMSCYCYLYKSDSKFDWFKYYNRFSKKSTFRSTSTNFPQTTTTKHSANTKCIPFKYANKFFPR